MTGQLKGEEVLETFTQYRNQLEELLRRGENEIYTNLRTLYEPLSEIKQVRINSELCRLEAIISVLSKLYG